MEVINELKAIKTLTAEERKKLKPLTGYLTDEAPLYYMNNTIQVGKPTEEPQG